MYFRELSKEKHKQLFEGFTTRFVETTNMTVAHVEIEGGRVLPEHSHEHEQITNLISGELEMTVGGETRVLKPGDVVIVPSNVKHSGRALQACYVVDVFNPPRLDFNDLK